MPEAVARVVEVRGLRRYFTKRGLPWRRPIALRAVDGVSFQIDRGEAFGIVGESGSGKSTVARCVLRLEKADEGQILVDGADITNLGPRELRPVRRRVQAVFQDPSSSLNPRWQVGQSVAEPLRAFGEGRQQSAVRVRELMQMVGLSSRMALRFPHELSGGQQQRVAIARALALHPGLIVADEPLSALDVLIQAQILNLLLDLKREFGLSYLFISHDLQVTQHLCETVAVFHLGKIVELGPSVEVFRSPRHPYTAALAASAATGRPDGMNRPVVLQGELPSPFAPPSGCTFRTRCFRAQPRCAQSEPPLADSGDGRKVACFFPLAGPPTE